MQQHQAGLELKLPLPFCAGIPVSAFCCFISLLDERVSNVAIWVNIFPHLCFRDNKFLKLHFNIIFFPMQSNWATWLWREGDSFKQMNCMPVNLRSLNLLMAYDCCLEVHGCCSHLAVVCVLVSRKEKWISKPASTSACLCLRTAKKAEGCSRLRTLGSNAQSQTLGNAHWGVTALPGSGGEVFLGKAFFSISLGIFGERQ